MNGWDRSRVVLICLVATMTIGACGSDQNQIIQHVGQNGKYPGFKDLSEGSASIQTAGEAVVLLENGTGVFVRYGENTYLMTNNHVFGLDDCAREGAYIEAYVDFQKGKKYKKQKLHLFPQAADIDVDVAFYRFEGLDDNGHRIGFQPSHVLELKSVTAEELVDQPIYIVGHPYRSIKKWTSGVVLRSENGLSVNTVLTVGGNSGSAVLNNTGELVGIHHSSSQRVSELTSDDFLVMGYDSPTKLLIAVLEDGLKNSHHLDRFTSITAAAGVSLDVFIDTSTFYLNAHQRPILEGNPELAGTLLERCESELNSWTPGDSEAFLEHFPACKAANDWLQCNRESDETHLICLNAEQRSQWLDLSVRLQEEQDRFAGNTSLESITWNVFDQFENETEGCREALSHLTSYLNQNNRAVDFTIAGLIARYSDTLAPVYRDIYIVDFLDNYTKQDYYWYDLNNLIYSVALMTYKAYELETAMGIPASRRDSVERMRAIYSRISLDEHLSVGAKLTLDRYAYAWNVMQW